jgi:hypothetical protein
MHAEDTPADDAPVGDRVGWGPTLIGGIVGAAIGVGLHLALEVGANYEAPWFAVITGLMTGIGVRQATKSHAHDVSYARGAMASIIALAAIVLSYPAISWALDMKSKAASKDSKKEQTAQVKTESGAGDSADDAATDAAPAEAADAAPAGAAPAGRIGAPKKTLSAQLKDFNLKQYLLMALGALVAYPLGRGSEASTRPPGEEPVMMDPSN